jgi:outer membrane protein assembly factor BamB
LHWLFSIEIQTFGEILLFLRPHTEGGNAVLFSTFNNNLKVNKFLLTFFFLGLFIAPILSQETWSEVLPNIGTFSSPRLSDLNRDGVKDIVLGGGRLEFQKCDTAMFALDGKNGKMLWHVGAIDQVFGSAALLDITGDGIEDVFLNGRSSELKAINGTTGQVIWAFDTVLYSLKKTKRWFNFYNPQFIHDVDKDGFRDILISNGGDIWVPPYNPNRATGRLVVLSSKTGKLLADANMPDGREIYMSISIDFNEKKPLNSKIIFGTGGETIGGNLYIATLDMVLKGNLSKSTLLDSSLTRGFISPPAWVNLTNDKQKDIVVAAVDGRLIAYDGLTNKKLWQSLLEGTEAYSSMAIGHFNKDTIPDFFVTFARGVWPDLSWTKQAMINGKNGKIEYRDSLGYYQTSSPVVADLTGDGVEEVILSVDYQVLDAIGRKSFYTTLYAIDFTHKQALPIIEGLPGHNVSSTPWLGDMDNDGFLDIVYCHGTNSNKTYTFDGLRVTRLKTTFPITKPIKWGSYMGSNYDGVFKQ